MEISGSKTSLSGLSYLSYFFCLFHIPIKLRYVFTWAAPQSYDGWVAQTVFFIFFFFRWAIHHPRGTENSARSYSNIRFHVADEIFVHIEKAMAKRRWNKSANDGVCVCVCIQCIKMSSLRIWLNDGSSAGRVRCRDESSPEPMMSLHPTTNADAHRRPGASSLLPPTLDFLFIFFLLPIGTETTVDIKDRDFNPVWTRWVRDGGSILPRPLDVGWPTPTIFGCVNHAVVKIRFQ